MKQILTLLFLIISFNTNAQFFKKIFKYSTVYTSGNISMPLIEDRKEFYVTQEGEVRDITKEPKFDYRYSIGWRKLARFDYENRQNAFYDGGEKQVTLSAGVGNVDNWEWLFNYDWARRMGREFNNQRYFLRYLGPWYIIKAEVREEGAINFNYSAADVRVRAKIGEKLNLSMGAIYRTSDKVFGLNPIEEYLRPDSVNWWDLARDYEYSDHGYWIYGDEEREFDWYWEDKDGNRVAETDGEFRRHVYKNLVNDYNREIFSEIGRMGYLSAVIGYDFYHYTDKFWFHNYLSVMPFHGQISGDKDFGYEQYFQRDGGKNWTDYQAGLVIGLKIKKWFGLFAEGEYSKLWDKKIYNAKVGFNVNFR